MSLTNFSIRKLHFKAPLHLSKGKTASYESSATTLHSDTLKSALYVSARQIFDESVAIALFDTVRVSSAFPFDEKGCWLPRPLDFKYKKETPETRKALKKMQYLTVAQMAKVLNAEQPDDLLDDTGNAVLPNIWVKDVTQRVKVHWDDDAEPFYMEKIYFKPHAGLFFIVELNGFDAVYFDAALRLLGDNGIGHQRHLGNGCFSFSTDTLSLELPTQAKAWMNISLYRPEDQAEIENIIEKSRYQIIKRGGWISSPEKEEDRTIRKKAVMMFAEGSVFAFPDNSGPVLTKGNRKIMLKPDFPTNAVWRDGMGLFLPIK